MVVVFCYTCLDIPVTANVFGHTMQKHKVVIQNNLQHRLALFRETLKATATSSSSPAPSAAIVSGRWVGGWVTRCMGPRPLARGPGPAHIRTQRATTTSISQAKAASSSRARKNSFPSSNASVSGINVGVSSQWPACTRLDIIPPSTPSRRRLPLPGCRHRPPPPP